MTAASLPTPALTALEIDALREVTNVGAGHAATALAQLTGVEVMIDIPRVWMGPLVEVLSRFAAPDARVAALRMHTLGDLTGQTLFVMHERHAVLLSDLLLQREPGVNTLTEELELSCLQESGNILSASFLNALAGWMGCCLLPSVPTLTIDRCDAVTAALGKDIAAEPVLVVETNFVFDQAGLPQRRPAGTFLFLLDRPSLGAILGALQVG